MTLTVPMRLLGQLDYDEAMAWLADLHAVMAPGTALVVEGVDRRRSKAEEGRVLWLASGPLVADLLRAAGWRWVTEVKADGPDRFRVSATR